MYKQGFIHKQYSVLFLYKFYIILNWMTVYIYRMGNACIFNTILYSSLQSSHVSHSSQQNADIHSNYINKNRHYPHPVTIDGYNAICYTISLARQKKCRQWRDNSYSVDQYFGRGEMLYNFSITITSLWARWLLKSLASRLSIQPFRAQMKESIKAPRHWPLLGELTGHRWIPHTKGQ